MYTNIPKSLSVSPSIITDTAIEDMKAKMYEERYFGTNTVEALEKDTYTKTNAKTGLPVHGKLTFKDKLRNFWNGTGGKVAKWIGLAATALILFRKGKGGKFSKFLDKFKGKAGKETVKAGEEAVKKAGITSKLSKLGTALKNKCKDIPSKLSNLFKKNKTTVVETADVAEKIQKALPAAKEVLKLPGA